MNRYAKRKARRRAIKSITRTLELILQMETEYFYSIPDSVANEERNSESEFLIGFLDCAVDDLRFIESTIRL
jgi:hypothetical protein